MKVVYVAGSFRAPNSWEIQKNVMAAMELALEVWKAGGVAICPHANTMFYQGATDDNIWLEGDLELVRRSDALLLVPGWANSEGTIGEVRLARELGLPIFECVRLMKEWLEKESA